MKPPALSLVLTSLLALPIDLADAVRLGIQGKHVRPHPRLQRRASLSGTTNLSNLGNIQYTTNITMGGNQFSVIIDTGSSDLYVTGDVPGSSSTGKSAGVQYAVGSVEGSVNLATLEFAGYTVDNQAYIDVPASTDNAVGTGLIGLGPNFGSQVHDALGTSQGDAVLDRIFQQNTSTPNFITILLSRDDDPADSFPGDLTVGEVLPGYESITSQPKLPVSQVSVSDIGDQHWQTLLDADGIIGPDGNAIDVDTVVTSTSNPKQLTAVFDSGFSLPQVPSAVSTAIYGGVPGAQLVNDQDLGTIWTLPCNVEINISFSLGSKNFPVNPLDTSLDLNLTDSNNNKICAGAFQPISTAKSTDFDLILGMAFIRNAYLSINFGDFVDGKINETAAPYIQLLSLTNDSAAVHADFIKVRGNTESWDPSGAESWIRSHLALVIGVAAGLGALAIAAIAFFCFRNRRVRRTPAGFMNLQSSYKPIYDPAPQAAYDMQPVGGYAAGGYAPPPGPPPQHQNYGNYNNPWDAHY